MADFAKNAFEVLITADDATELKSLSLLREGEVIGHALHGSLGIVVAAQGWMADARLHPRYAVREWCCKHHYAHAAPARLCVVCTPTKERSIKLAEAKNEKNER